MNGEIELGDRATEMVTGYSGIVVAETTWLNGCRRLTLQAQKGKDGQPAKTYTDDVMTMRLVEKDPLGLAAKLSRATGGPRPDPAGIPDVG